MDIDRIIRDIWCNEIKSDYEKDLLLREDSLKCSLYHHIRCKMEEEEPQSVQNCRIYAEFHWNNKRLDLAIVEIRSGIEPIEERVTAILVAIELKYKAYSSGYSEGRYIDDTTGDIKRLIELRNTEQKCRVYPIFIWEDSRNIHNISQIKAELKKVADGRLSVFFGYRDTNGGLVQEIL